MSPFVESAAPAAGASFRPLISSVTVDLDKSVLVQMAIFAVLIHIRGQ